MATATLAPFWMKRLPRRAAIATSTAVGDSATTEEASVCPTLASVNTTPGVPRKSGRIAPMPSASTSIAGVSASRFCTDPPTTVLMAVASG